MVRYAIIGIVWAFLYFILMDKQKKDVTQMVMTSTANVILWPLMMIWSLIDLYNWIVSLFKKNEPEENTDGSNTES